MERVSRRARHAQAEGRYSGGRVADVPLFSLNSLCHLSKSACALLDSLDAPKNPATHSCALKPLFLASKLPTSSAPSSLPNSSVNTLGGLLAPPDEPDPDDPDETEPDPDPDPDEVSSSSNSMYTGVGGWAPIEAIEASEPSALT
eukprot:CAMPEP_0173171018 /NCGR_PEP_ID=MMETSP1141-20130122/1535_1 /TAXON_ID=483371 /ORGANISM="non described non described, Strain CCMP2298" /LENGTH=144 /DNA_ID=CAMNT_0014092927 /DNA_START=755 /DNA_END=1189 /DNA_ORIENTATION=+